MLYGHKGNVMGIRKAFCKVDADKQGTDKSGGRGDRYGIYILQRALRIVKRAVAHLGYLLYMRSARKLGHHTAPKTVHLYLRGNDV